MTYWLGVAYAVAIGIVGLGWVTYELFLSFRESGFSKEFKAGQERIRNGRK